MMNFVSMIFLCTSMLIITYSVQSYPLSVSSSSKLANLPSSQIDQLCSYVSQLESKYSSELNTKDSESPEKRFARPFPDMNRFLSTSHKIHHHHHEQSNKKHDFHAYLCSLTQDSEEMSNFISIFIEEYGQAPAFNIFESCEQVAKRDQLQTTHHAKSSSTIRLNELSTFCSNRPAPRITKRWKQTVEGPISIDFIHQMLESRKVKPYPYRAEMDPYLVGR